MKQGLRAREGACDTADRVERADLGRRRTTPTTYGLIRSPPPPAASFIASAAIRFEHISMALMLAVLDSSKGPPLYSYARYHATLAVYSPSSSICNGDAAHLMLLCNDQGVSRSQLHLPVSTESRDAMFGVT